MTTFNAVPGPKLVTTMVNVAVSPAVIVCPSGVFTICSTGVWQVMVPSSWTCPAFDAAAVAVFGYVAHAWRLVCAVTTAVNEAPCASVPTLQCSAFATTVQFGVAVPHVRPAGSGSSMTTFNAVPGPKLVTTMVNVAVSPALIVCPSGVFTICSTGVWQVMVPSSWTWPRVRRGRRRRVRIRRARLEAGLRRHHCGERGARRERSNVAVQHVRDHGAVRRRRAPRQARRQRVVDDDSRWRRHPR